MKFKDLYEYTEHLPELDIKALGERAYVIVSNYYDIKALLNGYEELGEEISEFSLNELLNSADASDTIEDFRRVEDMLEAHQTLQRLRRRE